MFKRRKPDEAGAPAVSQAQVPIAAIPQAPTTGQAQAGGQPADRPGASFASPSSAPKSGTPAIPATKETQMGRSPFPAPPTPPVTGSAPSGPAPGSAPGMRPQMPGAPGGAPGAQARKDVSERRTLVVGRGISVQGVVQDAERLVVEGTVEASMIHATELAVAPGGVLRGEIEVEDAELAGTVDGTLTARGNLTIRATGRLIGTAKCRRLQVEDGGQVTGRLEMLTDTARLAPQPVGEPIQSSRPAPTPTPAVEPATV